MSRRVTWTRAECARLALLSFGYFLAGVAGAIVGLVRPRTGAAVYLVLTRKLTAPAEGA